LVPPKKLYRLIGEAIRTERKKAKLSQEKLAEIAELNRNYIGEVERGEKKIILETLSRIASALGLRMRDLIKEL